MFELALSLPSRGSRQLLRALHSQLRAAIVDGRLKPGLRLPPTREMASTYRVSRNTVVAAYDLLLTEGYLTAQRGAGTFVAAALPRKRDVKRAPVAPGTDRRLSPFWRTAAPFAVSGLGPAPSFDFRMGTPDIKAFPFEIWRRLYSAGRCARSQRRRLVRRIRKVVSGCGSRSRVMFRSRAPWPADRKISWSRLAHSRRSICWLRALVTPGRTPVAVENPGYPPARIALRGRCARLAPVPVDANGMVVSKLPRHARVICVTPSHQFPLGCVLSTERRVALLEFARRNGAVIVEDDYDGEFRFSGRPLDALQTLDRDESVFYVGTFSKSLFPAIRVGFIVAPPWARPALIAARQTAEGLTPWFRRKRSRTSSRKGISRGTFAKCVACTRKGEPRFSKGSHRLPGSSPCPRSPGLHLAAFTQWGVDADALEAQAARAGRRHSVDLAVSTWAKRAAAASDSASARFRSGRSKRRCPILRKLGPKWRAPARGVDWWIPANLVLLPVQV